ncbi:MAG TPA: hypothetical protein VK841_16905 [Polyangiaceae bacterium]|nr:hypothetical protein [Polyangiaceae bacterium]
MYFDEERDRLIGDLGQTHRKAHRLARTHRDEHQAELRTAFEELDRGTFIKPQVDGGSKL